MLPYTRRHQRRRTKFDGLNRGLRATSCHIALFVAGGRSCHRSAACIMHPSARNARRMKALLAWTAMAPDTRRHRCARNGFGTREWDGQTLDHAHGSMNDAAAAWHLPLRRRSRFRPARSSPPSSGIVAVVNNTPVTWRDRAPRRLPAPAARRAVNLRPSARRADDRRSASSAKEILRRRRRRSARRKSEAAVMPVSPPATRLSVTAALPGPRSAPVSVSDHFKQLCRRCQMSWPRVVNARFGGSGGGRLSNEDLGPAHAGERRQQAGHHRNISSSRSSSSCPPQAPQRHSSASVRPEAECLAFEISRAASRPRSLPQPCATYRSAISAA